MLCNMCVCVCVCVYRYVCIIHMYVLHIYTTQGRTKGIGRVMSIHYPDGTTATVAADSELSAGGISLCICVCVCVCVYVVYIMNSNIYIYVCMYIYTHNI